jgi:hypothetical protein
VDAATVWNLGGGGGTELAWVASVRLVLVLACVSSPARADVYGVYFTEALAIARVHGLGPTGIGPGLRLALGVRDGAWAGEATMDATLGEAPAMDQMARGLGTLSLSAKYFVPLSAHTELYIRSQAGTSASAGAWGPMLGAGAGVQHRWFVTLWGHPTTLGVWLDATEQRSWPGAMDVHVTCVAFGFAAGSYL